MVEEFRMFWNRIVPVVNLVYIRVVKCLFFGSCPFEGNTHPTEVDESCKAGAELDPVRRSAWSKPSWQPIAWKLLKELTVWYSKQIVEAASRFYTLFLRNGEVSGYGGLESILKVL